MTTNKEIIKQIKNEIKEELPFLLLRNFHFTSPKGVITIGIQHIYKRDLNKIQKICKNLLPKGKKIHIVAQTMENSLNDTVLVWKR